MTACLEGVYLEVSPPPGLEPAHPSLPLKLLVDSHNLGGHFRKATALKRHLQLSAKFFHLGQSKRPELSRCVELLFHAIKDIAVCFTISLILKERTLLEKGVHLHRNHKVNDCFWICRSQGQKMRLSF